MLWNRGGPPGLEVTGIPVCWSVAQRGPGDLALTGAG